MKKQLPTHNDAPSVPLPEKVIERKEVVTEGEIRSVKHTDGEKGTPTPPKVIETAEVNYEGNVRETKHLEIPEVQADTRGTLPVSKSVKGDYPIPDDEIDIYAVDSRIWDRIAGMGGGDGGGPHTHDGLYANKTHEHELEEHTHNYAPTTHGHDDLSPKSHLHPENAKVQHDHDNYADAQALADHLANHPSGGDGSGGSYDDTEVRALIQGNTDALDDKSDTDHTHDTTHNHNGLYSPTTHLHDDNYAEKTHTHDTSHNHDGVYAPTHNHPYASDTHKHDNLYQPKGNYALEGHTHEGGGGDGGGGSNTLHYGEVAFGVSLYSETSPFIKGGVDSYGFSTEVSGANYLYNDNFNYSGASYPFSIKCRNRSERLNVAGEGSLRVYPNDDGGIQADEAKGQLVIFEHYSSDSSGPFSFPIHSGSLELADDAQKDALLEAWKRCVYVRSDDTIYAYTLASSKELSIAMFGGTGSSKEFASSAKVMNAVRMTGTDEWFVEIGTYKGWETANPQPNTYRIYFLQSQEIPEQSARSASKWEVVCEDVNEFWKEQDNG
jgi:hypothetical protein